MLWHAIRYSQRLIPFTSGRFGPGSAVTSISPLPGLSHSSGSLVPSFRFTRVRSKKAKPPSVFSSDSRHINFDGLEAGKVYGGQVRALGGATGMNDWCDPTTHMAM